MITALRTDSFKKLQLNAGMFVRDFDPSSYTDASIPRSVLRDPNIPFWRYLSTTGLVEGDRFLVSEETYAKKLAEEGHRIHKNQYDRFKVEDYKETMADPTLFRVLHADKALVHVNDRGIRLPNRYPCIASLLSNDVPKKND